MKEGHLAEDIEVNRLCAGTVITMTTEYGQRGERIETGFACKSSQSQCYITTDGQSASLSWCQAPIRDPQPIFFPLFYNYF
jgi:hypothetical protein